MGQKPLINKMKNVDNYLQKAEKHCQQYGSKLTQKRKQMLTLLLDAEKAVSAYELIDLFETRFKQKLPPMSTYRILDYLEGVDLVHKINLANKFVACTHIGCHEHHHVAQLLFCQKCQRVDEMPINAAIYQCITDKIKQSGHQLCSQQIELSCICSACSNKVQSPEQNLPAFKQG